MGAHCLQLAYILLTKHLRKIYISVYIREFINIQLAYNSLTISLLDSFTPNS